MGLVQKADNNTEGKRRSGFFAGGVNPCIGTLASFFSLAFSTHTESEEILQKIKS